MSTKKRVVCPLLDVLDATTMGYKLILEKTEGSIQRHGQYWVQDTEQTNKTKHTTQKTKK